MAQSLASIIAQLQSDKVKPRQDALKLMDDALANDAVIERFSGNSDGWLAMFKALFVAISLEKAGFKKGKATSASITRFERAGAVLRNATERSVTHLTYKVVQPLLRHLMSNMVDKARDCLFAPVSLNYIKSIVVILSHRPHLEHLEPDLWISLVSLAFAVILEDNLADTRGFAENEFDEEVDQSDMDVDPEDLYGADNDLQTGSKRRRLISPRPDAHRRSSSTTPSESTRTLSQEKVEFIELLTILLRSPYAPYLSPGIAHKVLNRLHRFFTMFPTWSKAHANAIVSINVVLAQLELNMITPVTSFGLNMWAPLLSWWNSKEKKDKNVKEELVVTLTTLFPLVTRPEVADVPKNCIPERIHELYTCLQSDIDRSPAAFEGLSLDSLRLHLHNPDDAKDVFEATTFRSGSRFSPSQALTWTVLELHANCAQTLHVYSERLGSTAKRRRLETPLADILAGLRKDSVLTKRRCDILQVLLFIVDQHWVDFDNTLQQETCTVLLGLLAHDDPTLQSWTFLCLAAIAATHDKNDDVIDWNAIWSQAVHRTNVLNVGRAASHAAHVLLARRRLPMHRVLAEIEAFSTDLVIQGPTFPFDSVCAFICDCLRIASQDMRLHRAQLPDKVLGWLSQSWSLTGPDLRSQIPPSTVPDILTLLEATCGLSKPSQVFMRYLLPDCVLVDATIDRHRTAAIRTYLLHARLQPFRPPTHLPSSLPLSDRNAGRAGSPLAASNPREAKISTLLLKSLDLLCKEWESVRDAPMEATPEKVRRSIDAVVTALFFEASLVRNGIQSNRRVVQAACKLVEYVVPCLEMKRWNSNERALILMGLEPVISDDEPRHEDDPWDLLLGPGKGSGVKRSTLVKFSIDLDANRSVSLSARKELQSVLWQSADVQDTFEKVMAALRSTLEVVTDLCPASMHAGEEDKDFDQIQVGNSAPSTSRVHGRAGELCIGLCIAFLAIAPIRQSGTYNATRDKQLVKLLEDCEASAFLALAPAFLRAVRNKYLHLSVSAAEKLMDRLEEVLSMSYTSSRSVETTLFAIQFLHSTSHIWMQHAVADSKLTRSVRILHNWLFSMVSRGAMVSWKVRDRLVCYLDHYMSIDPREAFWFPPIRDQGSEDEEQPERPHDDDLPSRILPRMTGDEDARVRFRAAVANGRLLRTTEVTGASPLPMYERVNKELPVHLDKPEHMFSRFLCLGNAMVASSAVRRGSYWHLLEICLYDAGYTVAVEAVVSAVAQRLGFPNLRGLFEAYATQLVKTVIQLDKDFFRFPPSLLGYDDRRQCARITFPLLAPMVLVTTSADSTALGQLREKTFADHCIKANKSVPQGLIECFADIVGITIVHWVDGCGDSDDVTPTLVHNLEKLGAMASDVTELAPLIKSHLDRIVFSVLRTVCDDEFSKDGTITRALKSQCSSERATATFAALNVYRKSEDFKMHPPNLPAFSALTVLRSLNWLNGYFGDVFTPSIIYHVLHHLLAAIGSSALVNEQVRLLHALTIWISINGSSFRDRTLLRTLLRGAIILLSQSDIARIAQGILGWAFNHYLPLKSLEPTFPDLMSRIARIAHDYSCNADDPVLGALGGDLLDWIEKEAWTLGQEDFIRPQILSALPLWPREPSGALAHSAQEPNQSQLLSDILQDQYVTSGKFRLVRRLRDLAGNNAYTREQFCGQDFWHLKHCIPRNGDIQDEDIDAFVDILFEHAAQITPLNVGVSTSNLIAQLHQQASWTVRNGRRDTFKAVSPLRPIVLSLFNILSTESALQIHRAYQTLRLLFSLSIPELQETLGWSVEYQDEIAFLSSCPVNTVTARARSLQEFQTSERLRTMDFQDWICEVATLFSDVLSNTEPFYGQISSSIQSDPSFAAQMLPILVHGLLLSEHKDARGILSAYFSSILLEEEVLPQRCHSVVETVLHLRNFVPPSSEREDPLAHDKWLDIDFRLLSRGAMSCGSYTTALLFLELAADYSQSSSDTEATTEGILYDIYSHIEEPDGFYAIRSNDVHGFLTRRFHHEGQWDMAFKFHGADFAAGFDGSRGAEGIYQSLHANGFDRLAVAVLQSSNAEAAGTATSASQLGYELAWRTQVWDLPEPQDNKQAGSALYAALRAIHRNRDQGTVDALIKSASRQEISCLHSTADEDMVGIRSRVQTLICLGEIRKWRGVILQGQIAAGEIVPQDWEDFVDISPEFDFRTLESVIATRMSLLLSIKQREQREQIGDLQSPFISGLKLLEQKCLTRLSEAARLSEHHQTALNASVHARRLNHIPSFEVSQEFANVLWLLQEHKLAVEYLKGLVAGISVSAVDDQEVTRTALILSRLGTWSAKACLQKPTDIHDQFFVPATKLLLGSEGQEEDTGVDPALAVVFHQYALFAEEQYHAILRSPEVSRLKVYAERKKQEIEQLKESIKSAQSNTTRETLSQHQRKAEVIYGEDVAQISIHTESRITFLVQAIEMYSCCLQASDEFDDSAVIRLCSLWFANFQEKRIQSNVNRALSRIPSCKFIFLAHQLSARLSRPDVNPTKPPENQKQLQALIVRMCNEHPFHCLYQVWALQQGAPESGQHHDRRHSARGASVSLHSGRASAARDIFAICRQYEPNTQRVQSIERLCDAYLEWAKHPLKGDGELAKKQGVQLKLPRTLLRDILNLPVPVTTAFTPIDRTMRYGNIVTVVRYSSTFTLAGGQNLPKISECYGSDGHKYKQLFKGEGGDDLRQDAVMEQVFELVNTVLKRDRQTRKRQLSVRCYKVIPLAPQAGLLEFVDKTMQLAQWLIPAHKRYRPTDMSYSQCREAMKTYREQCSTSRSSGQVLVKPDRLRELFLGMLERFRPVFRHFFTERNKLPMAWFSTRLNYARSLATTSIVGHILGLGDRHASNILIDYTTGEVVHIDLGIAFDQGKLLKIPELVPFRLTGDTVDGLGTAGTEGVFRRCAEETLRVLRSEAGVITTVLEVFRHDPLHSWTASAIKIKRVQGPMQGVMQGSNMASDATGFGIGIDMASDAADESADRALTSVHRKLDQSLSVEYTVNELIVSATDPTNLSQLFFGWSPFF